MNAIITNIIIITISVIVLLLTLLYHEIYMLYD